MSTVISIEDVSKLYRLGEIGTGSLAHDVNRWWHKVRGNEDPYLQVGVANDRTAKGDSKYVYAIKDVSFEVKQGEALGIIGRNGAGKSTLLKILSRVTTPTSGQIKVKGRIASLLEVGTGFHPELTGRDNIFLNGAILGMRKDEIRSKFDEIVDFSGCERYIDTPVKRYSSGMYVRLAFAVAAHLEPEILIVDEVLAVGDAEFQKKCLGKMKDVAGAGRTVIFVSHNMDAVLGLCSRVVLLGAGTTIFQGIPKEAVSRYLHVESDLIQPDRLINIKSRSRHGTGHAKFSSLLAEPIGDNCFKSNSRIRFKITIESSEEFTVGSLAIAFFSETDGKIINLDIINKGISLILSAGLNDVFFETAQLPLTPGQYQIMLWMSNPETGEILDHLDEVGRLLIEPEIEKGKTSYPGRGGAVAVDFNFYAGEGTSLK